MNVPKNIAAIRKEKGLNQSVIAEAMNADNAVVSNIEKGKRELKVSELEIIAKALGVDVLYLLTYPEVYEKKQESKEEAVEAILQIKLQADKKEKILELIFGDSNLEILNKSFMFNDIDSKSTISAESGKIYNIKNRKKDEI